MPALGEEQVEDHQNRRAHHGQHRRYDRQPKLVLEKLPPRVGQQAEQQNRSGDQQAHARVLPHDKTHQHTHETPEENPAGLSRTSPVFRLFVPVEIGSQQLISRHGVGDQQSFTIVVWHGIIILQAVRHGAEENQFTLEIHLLDGTPAFAAGTTRRVRRVITLFFLLTHQGAHRVLGELSRFGTAVIHPEREPAGIRPRVWPAIPVETGEKRLANLEIRHPLLHRTKVQFRNHNTVRFTGSQRRSVGMPGFDPLAGIELNFRYDICTQAIHPIHFQPGGSVIVDIKQPTKLVLGVSPLREPICRGHRRTSNNGVDRQGTVRCGYLKGLNIPVRIGNAARIRNLNDIGRGDHIILFIILQRIVGCCDLQNAGKVCFGYTVSRRHGNGRDRNRLAVGQRQIRARHGQLQDRPGREGNQFSPMFAQILGGH